MIEGLVFQRQPYALTLLMIKIPASLLACSCRPLINHRISITAPVNEDAGLMKVDEEIIASLPPGEIKRVNRRLGISLQ